MLCVRRRIKHWSVTHGQCDARPTVTFPAAGHHRPLTGAKFILLRDTGNFPRSESGTVEILTRDLCSRKSNALTTTPPGQTVLITLPLILQTITVAQMLSIGEVGDMITILEMHTTKNDTDIICKGFTMHDAQ